MATWHESKRCFRVWEIKTWDLIGVFAADSLRVALDRELLVAADGHEAVAWSLASGQERWRVTPERRGYRNCMFLGDYVRGTLLRRTTGEVMGEAHRPSEPRTYADCVLWLLEDTLVRLAPLG